MNKPGELRNVIFTPEEIAEATLRLVTERVKNPKAGLATGISGLDGTGRLLPMRPGELITVLGYTSHGKSSLANRIMRNNAAGIIEAGEASSKAVVTVTWEQSIEEQGIYDVAYFSQISVEKMLSGTLDSSEIEKLIAACEQRKKVPWWLLGHSSAKEERRPRLTMWQVSEALFMLRNTFGVTPILVVLDYLQRMNRQGLRGEMREQYIQLVDDAKDLALSLSCPVILVSQTGRQVHNREIGLPELDDGQETSNLEQSSDKMLGTWLPKHKYADGKLIVIGSKGMLSSSFLMFIRIVKQRLGKAPLTMPFFFKPEINQLSQMEWLSDVELQEELAKIKKRGGRTK